MALVAQGVGRCLIPGKIQGRVGQGSEKPDPVGDVPAWGLEQMTFKGPFQPEVFYFSIKWTDCSATAEQVWPSNTSW